MTLRYLFVDMNAFFASVEQEDRPELRGKPIAVVPVLARTTACIAASYEAKAFGIKTGTPVWEALKLCPDLELVVGRHERYVEIHHRIVQAVGRCLPIEKVMSVDEMVCKLIGDERTPEKASVIAGKVKAEIRSRAGSTLCCSIGVGPNVLLAKVAGDMQKPDGLTLIQSQELPKRLYSLKLTDLPGIGPRMEKRLHRYGVTTIQQLYRLTVRNLSDVWGSRVHGERWYHVLRGEDLAEKPTKRRTLGHTHILPPQLRTDAGAHGVFARLLHKAAARLRTIDYWAGALTITLRMDDGRRWASRCHLPRCQDTLALLRAFAVLWKDRPEGRPMQVGLVLTDLVPARSATPSLFPDEQQATALSHAIDRVNRSFGKHTVRFGTMWGAEDTAPTRVAFNHIPEFNPAFE